MRVILLALLLANNIVVASQSESLFKERVQFVLKEYESGFASYVKDKKHPSLPSQTVHIQPGLTGKTDQLHIWHDTLFQYGSDIYVKGDSSVVSTKIAYFDSLLQLSLGSEFSREKIKFHFNEKSPTAVIYKSSRLRVAIIIAKFKVDQYLLLIGFSGTVRKKET